MIDKVIYHLLFLKATVTLWTFPSRGGFYKHSNFGYKEQLEQQFVNHTKGCPKWDLNLQHSAH